MCARRIDRRNSEGPALFKVQTVSAIQSATSNSTGTIQGHRRNSTGVVEGPLLYPHFPATVPPVHIDKKLTVPVHSLPRRNRTHTCMRLGVARERDVFGFEKGKSNTAQHNKPQYVTGQLHLSATTSTTSAGSTPAPSSPSPGKVILVPFFHPGLTATVSCVDASASSPASFSL